MQTLDTHMHPTKYVRHDPAEELLYAAVSCKRLNHLVIHCDDWCFDNELVLGEQNVLLEIVPPPLHPGCPGKGYCAILRTKTTGPMTCKHLPCQGVALCRHGIDSITFVMFSAVSKSSATADACLPKLGSLRPNLLRAYPVFSCLIHALAASNVKLKSAVRVP